jgi:WD40 repeat protein
MIHTQLRSRYLGTKSAGRARLVSSLLESRNLFNIQTIEYDLVTVISLDIDATKNFILVGSSNGSVDLQEIDDPTYGNMTQIARFTCGQYNVNRVQWNPATSEQFFSILDNHVLHIVDPVEMRVIDKYEFNMKTNWSEWNPNDPKTISVCGSESQVRLVDIRTGSSAQTVILAAQSGLSSHRATRCLWSRHDTSCLIVGDNEGFLHVYDTRHSSRPFILAGEERGQISGMSFAADQFSLITTQGTENQLVEWSYDKCKLVANSHKFKKRKPIVAPEQVVPGARASSKVSAETSRRPNSNASSEKLELMQQKRRITLPVSAYIRCQFHVTDSHVFCPVPSSSERSKEIYMYDLKSGDKIKTLKSDDILSQGIYSVTSLLPESLVIYVGGRGRLRAWSIDEGYQRKLEERMNQYHRTRWDSDDET